MINKERKSSGLLHSADELKQLIAENPDLPILVFAGDDANNGDYAYMSCSYVSAEKGEFLDCDCEQQIDERKCYTDREDLKEDIAYIFANEEEFSDLLDDEFDYAVAQEVASYDEFWKPCIILRVDN